MHSLFQKNSNTQSIDIRISPTLHSVLQELLVTATIQNADTPLATKTLVLIRSGGSFTYINMNIVNKNPCDYNFKTVNNPWNSRSYCNKKDQFYISFTLLMT